MPLGFENTGTLFHECRCTFTIAFHAFAMSASYTVEKDWVHSACSFLFSLILSFLPPVETAIRNGHYASRYKRTFIVDLYPSTFPRKSFRL